MYVSTSYQSFFITSLSFLHSVSNISVHFACFQVFQSRLQVTTMLSSTPVRTEKLSNNDLWTMASPIRLQSYDESVVTHSFLLSNLHCPSCVSHIQESLSKLHPISVSPSLVSSWVTVEHKGSLPAREIRGALEDAGFDVCDVTPEDDSRRTPLLPGLEGETGYLDHFINKVESGRKDGSSTKSGPSKKHIQNCSACRLTSPESETNHRFSSTLSRTPLATAANPSAVIRHDQGSKSELRVIVEADNAQKIWRASLAVGGMTCASCVNAITTELQNKAWIKKVTVNLISNSASVDFVEEQHQSDIVEAIEDIGYDATIDTVVDLTTAENNSTSCEKANRSVEILVGGMFCDHCPARILSSLERFEGRVNVEDALSLNNPILKISYTPEVPIFTIRSIMKAISDSTTDNDEPFKVSIYHPPTLEERSRRIHQRERIRILIRVLFTFVIAIPTLIIGIIYMSLVPASDPGRKFLMASLRAGVSRAQWSLFIMATPIYFLCADIFHLRALKEIRAMWRPGSTTPMLRRFYRFGSMNMLMSLGTSIAYISSIAQLIAAGTNPRLVPDNNSFYFDSVVFLTLFLLLGRLIEAYSKSRTGDAVLMLGKLRPVEALLIESPTSAGESLTSISVDLLEYGDVVKVLHGASPPCDGTISHGDTKFDESSLTGESRLVKKKIGDNVLAGTINKDLPVSIKVRFQLLRYFEQSR